MHLSKIRLKFYSNLDSNLFDSDYFSSNKLHSQKMGLSKSKAEKSVQQGFPNQPGFSTAPGQFPSFASPSGAFGSQSFPAAASGFGAPGFSSQASFPPFPAQMPGQMGGFPNNQIFGQAPLVSSSNFPVSYPGQRMLIFHHKNYSQFNKNL